MEIKLEDRVFLGERKGAYRVVGFGTLNGEKAVSLINTTEIGLYRDWKQFRETWEKHNPPGVYPFEIVRRVPVADLVRDDDRHGWRERWRQQEMDFSTPPPPPPSGPVAEPYSPDDSDPSAFFEFLNSPEGQDYWAFLASSALKSLKEGDKRFSVRGCLYAYRALEKGRVCNDFTPWFADMLVKEYPELLDTIQRKRRKKPGPFDTTD